MEVPGALHADRAARAAELTAAVLPVLRPLEQGQHGVEVPAGVAGLRPAVVVGPVAAGPYHGVDAARSTEHLPERQGDGAVIDVRARRVMVSPVVWRADVLHPLRRIPEAFDTFIRSAGFEHENGSVGAVQQAPRDHATRRAGADDHVVVTSVKYLAALNLTMNLNHGVSLLESQTVPSDHQLLLSGRSKKRQRSKGASLQDRGQQPPGASPVLRPLGVARHAGLLLSAIMRNYAEAVLREEKHLAVPSVGAQRPAVRERYDWAFTPVLVV